MDSDSYNNPRGQSYGAQGQQQKHSRGELLSSAKLVADAAQSTFCHEPHKIDRAKFADAAGDLLDAAGEYGNQDQKGVGKYVDKAADYLHQYSSTTPGGPLEHGGDGRCGSTGSGGGGIGVYMKNMAQDFMKSDSSSGSHTTKSDSYGSGVWYGDGGRSGGSSGGNERSGGGYGGNERSGGDCRDGLSGGGGYGNERSTSGYGNERDDRYGGDERSGGGYGDGRTGGGYRDDRDDRSAYTN